MQRTQYADASVMDTAFTAAGATVQGYFETSAATTTPVLALYAPTHPASVPLYPRSPEAQLFALAYFAVNYLGYTGFAGGLDTSVTQQEVTDFVTYVNVSTD